MKGVNPKKWDIWKPQESKEIKKKYQRRDEEKIGGNREGGEEGNVEENWERIEKVTKEVAEEIVGK
jgi:hypothetical protein